MSESNQLASQIGKASAVIMFCSMADKILAVGKEMVTAHRFGISSDLDVFNVTHSFPGILVLLFSGALVSAFVPLYLEWSRRSSFREADSHAMWLVYLSAMFFAGLTLVCFLFSPAIVGLIGYGFGPAERQLGIAMERLLVLLILIDGIGILFRGILHARKMFFHLYVAPIFINLTIIFFLLFAPGIGIYVLLWGFLIGTLLRTVYMGFALYRGGFQYKISHPFDPSKVKSLLWLTLPLIGSELIANSNLMIDLVMATQLSAGAVSTLRYAFRVNDLPIQVVIMAVSRAIFPFVSQEAAAGNRENLRSIYRYSLIFLAFLTIPITGFMLLFSQDIVVLLLQRGAFDREAAEQTAKTLNCFSLGLFLDRKSVV